MDPIGINGPVGDGQSPSNGADSAAGAADRGTDADAFASGTANDHRRHSEHTSGQRQKKRRKQEPFIPTWSAVLATLSRLPALIATGALAPAQANAMRGALQALLDELRPDNLQAGARGVDMPQMQDVLRRHPDLLHVVEPMLSDEELRELVGDDDGHDEADKD